MDKIEKMFLEELEKASNIFLPFQSRHEAYAVMMEELEEAEKEFEDIKEGLYNDYWNTCRNSKTVKGNKTLEILDHLENAVKCNIMELIQVGAMIKKAKLLEVKIGIRQIFKKEK